MSFKVSFITMLGLMAAGATYAAPPFNDACNTPKIVGALPYTDTIDASAATTDAGEHDQCGCSPNGHSTWWSYTAPTSGVVRADTSGSLYDTVLSVSTGACPGNQILACDDDYLGSQSQVQFTACAGHSYLIKTAAYCTAAAASTTLTVDLVSAGEPDGDGDGVGDCSDRCPNDADPAQADTDGDGVGDVCDACPAVFDPTNDPLRCTDGDGDGVVDAFDDCRSVADPGQEDADGDGIGDACDTCPHAVDPAQADADGDGIGDACDSCTDPDGDGFGSPHFSASTCPIDDCPDDYDPDQADRDGDGIGDACLVCGYVGPFTRWAIAARQSWNEVTTRQGGYTSGSWVSTCMDHGVIGAFDTEGSMVATRSRGRALGFLPIRNQEIYPNPTRIRGDLLTGGGRVTGPVSVAGITDTTGGHPDVAQCAAVLADMTDASARLAALPPTQTLGAVNLHRGSETRDADYFELDLSPGDVVNIDALTLEGFSFRRNPGGYVYRDCGSATYTSPELYISGGPAVVNLGALTIGNCARVYLDGDILFNVPGPGRKVTIGLAAYGGSILAPLRTIATMGSDDDYFTEAAFLWGKRVQTTGATWLYGNSGSGSGHCAEAD